MRRTRSPLKTCKDVIAFARYCCRVPSPLLPALFSFLAQFLTHCFPPMSHRSLFYRRRRYFNVGTGKKTGLVQWSKKGGTGKNENMHGNLNRLVDRVARLGEEECDRRLLQHVHHHNYKMDRKLGRTSAQSTLWPWRERKVNAMAEAVLASRPFPKTSSAPVSSSCRT